MLIVHILGGALEDLENLKKEKGKHHITRL